MSLSPSDEQHIREIVRQEWALLNEGRAGSTEPTDKRGSPRRSVEEDQHVDHGVSARALDTREGSRAVGDAAVQDEAFRARHFPKTAGRNHLPPEVDVSSGNIVSLWAGKITGEIAALLEKLSGDIPFSRIGGELSRSRTNGTLPAQRLEGKVARGNIEDNLNGDRLIRDGTLGLAALASRPWATKQDIAGIRKRLTELEKKAHKHGGGG